MKLVSAICLTRNRREFLPGAIADFLAQDYPEKELLVVDSSDEDKACWDLIPAGDSRVRYLRAERESIGALRNLACEMARGEIIAHWDDDDLYFRRRISEQVEALAASGAEVTGYRSILFRNVIDGRLWSYADTGESYVVGVTLCYRKRFWQTRKFPDLDVGEDNEFLRGLSAPVIYVQPGVAPIVARIHPGNTIQKSEAAQLRNAEFWREVA